MTVWKTGELTRIADTEEMRIAGRRRDGTLRPPRIVWMVAVGDDLYTRSVNGPDAAWFRGARATHEGRVSAGGVDTDVALVEIAADDEVQTQLDAAYRDKYGRRYPGPTASVTSPTARSATLKLLPLQTGSEK
jgi:hypothetical protein